MPTSHRDTLAGWLAAQPRAGRALIVGINGAQGSGKSTLANMLRERLERDHGLRAVVISLDDFYLTRAEREALGRRVHPLLATRGVPGTHDVALLRDALERLRTLGKEHSVRIPAFIKVFDERAPGPEWRVCSGPIDVVLFEGWCVGTPPQVPDELRAPVNALEAREDADGRWRAYVNDQLATTYAALFARLDRLVLLQAPGFEVVHGWRLQQEGENEAAAGGAARGMTPAQVERFIAHYERLTRHALRVLPARADVVLELDAQRHVAAARYSA